MNRLFPLFLFSTSISSGARAFMLLPTTSVADCGQRRLSVNCHGEYHQSISGVPHKPVESSLFDTNPLHRQRWRSGIIPLSVTRSTSTNDDESCGDEQARSLEMEASKQRVESWENDSKLVELVLLVTWAASISAFILINNFIGPWPEIMKDVPERIYFVIHMMGGMLFGGGIILTTCIEWLVVQNKNSPVLQFWFDKVPLLDAAIVLPALTAVMASGTGLSIVRYGSLGSAPTHISIVFHMLILFAVWWALTDLTTQGMALTQINEWAATAALPSEEDHKEIPRIVELRKISNVVSCLFVVALYYIMVMKPGTL